MKCKSVILGLLAATTLFLVGKPTVAAVDYKTYLNPSTGPWFMEVSNRIFDPANNSKWAFGYFGYCYVPHLESTTYYAWSYNPSFLPDDYNGSTAFTTLTPNGNLYNIGTRTFAHWRPSGTGGSMSLYVPAGGSPQYITVSAGTSIAKCSASMQSNTYSNQRVAVVENSYYTCCENGQGCP